MKKTLTAVFATFLIAAPLQTGTASAKLADVDKETILINALDKKQIQLIQEINCQVSYNGSNHKWEVRIPQQLKEKWLEAVKAPVESETAEPTPPVTETPAEAAPSAPETPAEAAPSAPETPAEAAPSAPETPAEPTPSAPERPTEPAAPVTEKPVESVNSSVSAFEQEVVKLTNAERTKAGLAPFQMDEKLMAAAREKSQDMQSQKYFSHTSPTYGSPFDRMNALGISYKSAGENIAQGQRTPQEVVQAWMDSPGHRANILNAQYTHIGVGYVENGHYWTQQFIQK